MSAILKLEEFYPENFNEEKKKHYHDLQQTKGTYFAVLTIVFQEWSDDDRKSVMSNILADKGDADKYTRLIYHTLNVKTHIYYVKNHVDNVKTGMRLFNHLVSTTVKRDVGIEPDVPGATEEQIAGHDLSKHSFTECVTYAMKWHNPYPTLEPSEEFWQKGLQHHYSHNEHHPEFFPEGEPMPWRYLVEALYDMTAVRLDKVYNNVVPDDAGLLLDIPDVFLNRFKRTGQFELMKSVIERTKYYYSNSAIC